MLRQRKEKAQFLILLAVKLMTSKQAGKNNLICQRAAKELPKVTELIFRTCGLGQSNSLVLFSNYLRKF